MSNPCRQFRTMIMTGGAKLLIVRGCATVAEGRQATNHPSHRNNKAKQHKVRVASRCGVNALHKTAHQVTDGTLSPDLTFLCGHGGFSHAKRAFNFAYCRPFSTLHRSLYVTYTEVRIVIALTV